MRLAFSVLVAFFSFVASAKPLLPALTVDTGDGRHALQLVGIRVDTIIRGHLARTECELTYRNDLDAVVEGEFAFPLPAGAELTGLGLYFNNRLRHAVAVERERARVAYETSVHRGVDPALAEWSAANAVTLRVYPIPAKGEKKVWLSYDQELIAGDYVLDLRYGKRLRSIDVRIDADGRFVRDSTDVTYDRPYRLVLTDSVLDRQLIAEADARTEVLTARDETNRWYLAAAPRSSATARAVEPAREVVVFWDTSGSAMQQQRDKLDAFLAALTARQESGARVTFIPFDLTAGDPVTSIDNLHAIGATNYLALFARMREVMEAAPPTTRFLLVTDGVTSLGNRRDVLRAAGALNRAVTVVNASPQGDDLLLTQIAATTNGWLLDLGELSTDDAVDAAMRAAAPYGISSSVASIVASRRAGHYRARIPIAATTDVKPYLLPLRLGDETRELPIRELRQPREIAMVRSAYARAALRQLLLSNASDEQLLEHGRRFQQLTPRTSFLVLETWRDYERLDLPLPDDVRREKEAEEKERGITLSVDGPATSDVWLIDALTVDVQGTPLPGATVTLTAGRDTRNDVTNERGRARLGLPYVPPAFTLRAELSGLNPVTHEIRTHVSSGTTITLVMGYAAVAEAITVTAEAAPVPATMASTATSFIGTASTANDDALLKSLFADPQSEDVLARRRATLDAVAAKMATLASVDERVRYYLTARAAFGGDKAFHLQAATLFQHDAPQLAVRILTELAEAYPDDGGLLRILARILEGWNENELARLLLQHAMEVGAGEEQTWRELALLESRLGNKDAIEQFAHDAASADQSVRDDIVAAIDDIRTGDDADFKIDLMWDTSFTDIDLYVTEPGGEQVWYQHMKSKQGGDLHRDVTDGYGPEIYTIRNPAPGEYKIAIDYFGVDDTDVNFETLAHLVVYQRTRAGVERQEFILVLSQEKDHRAVATIQVGR